MFSQEAVHVSLFVGNTDSRRRDSGHLAVSTSVWVAGLITPAQSPDAGPETRLGSNQERKGRTRTSVLTSAHLGRSTADSQGFKPDLGNPAVRDYRGASGTVSHGGNEIPPRNRKSETGNPPPTARRAGALSQQHAAA